MIWLQSLTPKTKSKKMSNSTFSHFAAWNSFGLLRYGTRWTGGEETGSWNCKQQTGSLCKYYSEHYFDLRVGRQSERGNDICPDKSFYLNSQLWFTFRTTKFFWWLKPDRRWSMRSPNMFVKTILTRSLKSYQRRSRMEIHSISSGSKTRCPRNHNRMSCDAKVCIKIFCVKFAENFVWWEINN